jgi:hypothetical protein
MRIAVLVSVLSLLAATSVGCNGSDCGAACQRTAKECGRGSQFEQDCELQCHQTSMGPCISEYAAYTACVADAPDKVDCASLEPASCRSKFDTYAKCLTNAQ